jgi:hypothetical protein
MVHFQQQSPKLKISFFNVIIIVKEWNTLSTNVIKESLSENYQRFQMTKHLTFDYIFSFQLLQVPSNELVQCLFLSRRRRRRRTFGQLIQHQDPKTISFQKGSCFEKSNENREKYLLVLLHLLSSIFVTFQNPIQSNKRYSIMLIFNRK